MTKAVVDRDGVLLEVEYEELGHVDGVKMVSIRTLGHDYRPVGPNLTEMLAKVFSLTGPGSGVLFLSGVADELA